MSPLLVRIAVWMVNTCSVFQVNIFSNNRDTTKMSKFSHDDDTADDKDDAKATAISRVFYEKKRAKQNRQSNS